MTGRDATGARSQSRTRGGGGRQPLLDSGIVEVSTDDDTNDVASPLTAPIRAITLKEVAFDLWMMGLTTDMQARVGVQLSNNPVDFSGATAHVLIATYKSSKGWNYGGTFYDLSSIAGITDPDYKLFLRFVALAKRKSAGSGVECGQVRLVVHHKPVVSRTLVSPLVRVYSKGSTSTSLFVPVTDAMPTDGLAMHRVSTEVTANLGISLQPAYQETDTLDDPSSWTTATTLESAITTNTVQYPGNVVSITPTKRFIRYGADSKNISGTAILSALVRMTLDLRDR